jgi:hypothetical protein
MGRDEAEAMESGVKMTDLQSQLYDAIVRTNAARQANDLDAWLTHDRERSRLLVERQREMANERRYQPVQFERTPNEGLLDG